MLSYQSQIYVSDILKIIADATKYYIILSSKLKQINKKI